MGERTGDSRAAERTAGGDPTNQDTGLKRPVASAGLHRPGCIDRIEIRATTTRSPPSRTAAAASASYAASGAPEPAAWRLAIGAHGPGAAKDAHPSRKPVREGGLRVPVARVSNPVALAAAPASSREGGGPRGRSTMRSNRARNHPAAL